MEQATQNLADANAALRRAIAVIERQIAAQKERIEKAKETP